MRRLLPLSPIALLLTACGDGGDPSGPIVVPLEPRAAIQDAAHEGLEHFFFLPPLVPDPEPTGTFHAGLEPIVRICELGDGDPPACEREVREFTTGGSGADRIRVDEDEERYRVEWNTRRDDLSPGSTYRIRVFLGEGDAPAVGFIDVRPGGSGAGNPGRGGPPDPDPSGDEVVVFRNGSTLPIAFRIEEGVFCESGDCARETVTDEGGTVVTNTGFAGVQVPPGALPDGVDEVTISIERIEVVDASACLPLPATRRQFEGCYAIDSEPAGIVFDELLVIAICLDPAAEPRDLLLHKFDPDRPQDGVLTLPSGGPVDFLECDDFAPTESVAAGGGPLATFARAALRTLLDPVARALEPSLLRAGDLGASGLSPSLSDFGWAEPESSVVLELVDPEADGQEGAAGASLPVAPTVSVTDLHQGPDPTPDVEVTFEFTDPAGGVTSTPVRSDADGLASLDWLLSAAGGTHRLAVFTPESNTVELAALARGPVARWSGEDDFVDGVGAHDLQTRGGIGFVAGTVGSRAFAFTRGASTSTTGGWAYAHPTPDVDLTDRFTLATWVRLDADGPAGEFQRFVSLFGEKAVLRQDPPSPAAEGTGRTLRFYMKTDASPNPFEGFSFDDALQTSCWHHVAATFDGGEQALYLDGEELGRRTIEGPGTVAGDGVFLSSSDDGGGWPPLTGANAEREKLAGALDEVEIYNEALGAAEIQAKWEAGGGGRCGAAPAPDGSAVSGTVFYSTTGLEGVAVELVEGSATDPALQSTTTDAAGAYAFSSVPDGTYWVKAYAPTPEFIEWKAVEVSVEGSDVSRDVDLPKKIALVAPEDGSVVASRQPLLEWEANPEAETYTVQVDVTDPWTPVEHESGILTNSHTVGTPLTGGVGYTWQVDAYDGSGHHVGTTDRAFELTVSFLVFESDRDGDNEVYRMEVDGTDPTAITSNTFSDGHPTISPDGTRIAYASFRDGSWDIYAAAIDGSGEVRLTTDPGVDAAPDWSPDGTKIAFHSDRDGDFDVHVMSADGSDQVRLADIAGDDAVPDWSPDGSRIAFRSDPDGGSTEIYVMDADGSDVTLLVDGGADDPDWSPDGGRIAFQRAGDIWIVDADGTGETRLTATGDLDFAPAWAPDGTLIAFVRSVGVRDVLVVRPDGTGVTNLTNDATAIDHRPAWR